MASYTPNYNLKKPADSDYYDIADDNGNMDKIDTALNTLNAKITGINNALRPTDETWLSNKDANNYMTTGLFMFGTGNTNVPMPWGILIVIANRNDTVLQIYEANSRMYFRETRGTWGDWRELAWKSDFALKTTDIVTSAFRLYRSGNMVYAACLGGNAYSCDSAGGELKYDGSVISVPAGYKPLYGADTRDTLQNKRVSVASNGQIAIGEAFTASAIRFTITWMTGDAYPT